jgi:plastocyanin
MKKIIIVIVVIVVIIGIYYFTSTNNYSGTPQIIVSSVSTTTTTVLGVPANASSSVSTSTLTSTVPVSSDTIVEIKNFSFNPSTLTIKTGSKVTWINNDVTAHTVTSNSGNLLNSKPLSPGQSFSFTFTNPASVNYHCNIHPMMKGQIIVQN